MPERGLGTTFQAVTTNHLTPQNARIKRLKVDEFLWNDILKMNNLAQLSALDDELIDDILNAAGSLTSDAILAKLELDRTTLDTLKEMDKL